MHRMFSRWQQFPSLVSGRLHSPQSVSYQPFLEKVLSLNDDIFLWKYFGASLNISAKGSDVSALTQRLHVIQSLDVQRGESFNPVWDCLTVVYKTYSDWEMWWLGGLRCCHCGDVDWTHIFSLKQMMCLWSARLWQGHLSLPLVFKQGIKSYLPSPLF